MRRSGRFYPVVVMLLLVFSTACREKTKLNVASNINTDTMPTMTTVNISTLISDSGVTQYKIVAPLWKVFDEGDDPYWLFPKGIYLRKYDKNFKVIASIAADSAKYFKNRRLWRLDGNVEVRKMPADLFLTQQVYWDQRLRQVYSDSFIHVENETHMLEGQGFRSNEDFTVYNIVKPTGIFPVNPENVPTAQAPSADVSYPGLTSNH